jgi:hypothetical protein
MASGERIGCAAAARDAHELRTAFEIEGCFTTDVFYIIIGSLKGRNTR